MTEQTLYLRQNVLVEPLFNQWYAWPYLIAPATAAMYVENWHLRIMRSFISNPGIHIAAVKNPDMLGGPFMNHPVERMDEVKQLLDKTLQCSEPLLGFAAAVKSLDKKLQSEAIGHSFESMYQEIPEPLKGYVELVYDLNNHPSIRFLEGLLYKSPYYWHSAQSVALSLINQDSRPFILTTPLLDESKHLNLQVPFSHSGLDQLFKMKTFPGSLGDIKMQLGIKEKDSIFSSFFTEEPPLRQEDYAGGDIRIRYYGHACILLETSKISILLDPLVSYKYDNCHVPRYTFEDLPERIDYVLITHNHQDHILLEVLLQLRYKIGVVVVPKSGSGGLADPSLKLLLKNIGFENVIEMDEMDEIDIEDGILMGIPFLGEHSDLNIRAKQAYLVRLKGSSILCIADSNNLQPELYMRLHSLIGNVDVLFVGMECEGAPLSWLYGPLLTKPIQRSMDQSRRLDGSHFEKAMNIVERLRPQHVYIYAMGQEPWLTHLTSICYTEASRPIIESNKLVEACDKRGIKSARLFGKSEITLPAQG